MTFMSFIVMFCRFCMRPKIARARNPAGTKIGELIDKLTKKRMKVKKGGMKVPTTRHVWHQDTISWAQWGGGRWKGSSYN